MLLQITAWTVLPQRIPWWCDLFLLRLCGCYGDGGYRLYLHIPLHTAVHWQVKPKLPHNCTCCCVWYYSGNFAAIMMAQLTAEAAGGADAGAGSLSGSYKIFQLAHHQPICLSSLTLFFPNWLSRLISFSLVCWFFCFLIQCGITSVGQFPLLWVSSVNTRLEKRRVVLGLMSTPREGERWA